MAPNGKPIKGGYIGITGRTATFPKGNTRSPLQAQYDQLAGKVPHGAVDPCPPDAELQRVYDVTHGGMPHQKTPERG